MWIKICGITTAEDAELVASAGADAIGLNFFSGSKRFVHVDIARAIRNSLNNSIEVVGVFVNSSATEVAEIASQVRLSTVQFHGDESVETISKFHRLAPDVAIIRAFRIGSDGSQQMLDSLRELRAAKISLKAVLVDALVAGEYGGTGQQVALNALPASAKQMLPLILAGGLTPTNVADAVQRVRPWGVDTASGVETAPGVKSAEKIGLFVKAVRDAAAED